MANKATGSSFGPIGELPKEFDLNEFPNMHGEDPPKDPKLTNVNQVVADIGKSFTEGFAGSTPTHWAQVLRAYFLSRRMVFVYFGGNEFLPDLSRNPYADRIYTAAVAYLQNAMTLKQQVPAITVNVNDDQLRTLVEHLGQLNAMEKGDRSIDEGFDRLKANIEDSIYTTLSVIYHLAKHTVPTHLTLSEHLGPLMELFTMGAQVAAENRKSNEKVVKATTERVIGAVQRAMDDAKKAPQPQTPGAAPPPAPPAIDLDAIKSEANRGRGRGRGEPR